MHSVAYLQIVQKPRGLASKCEGLSSLGERVFLIFSHSAFSLLLSSPITVLTVLTIIPPGSATCYAVFRVYSLPIAMLGRCCPLLMATITRAAFTLLHFGKHANHKGLTYFVIQSESEIMSFTRRQLVSDIRKRNWASLGNILRPNSK